MFGEGGGNRDKGVLVSSLPNMLVVCQTINASIPTTPATEHVGLPPTRKTISLTTDPRIPTSPGRSKSGFHRPDQHCVHHARSAVRHLV